MKKFGLACEGHTDKAVIKNILKGYFSIKNQNNEIVELQPPFGDKDGGGWRPFLTYLTLERFEDDVKSSQYFILHIDTDASNDFGVQNKDNKGNRLATEILIHNIISKLISKINEKEAGIYERYANRIIFAISVDSIECWLVAYFSEKIAIERCDEVLKETKLPDNIQFSKSRKSRCHEKLSLIAFENSDKIEIVRNKDTSFNAFIQQLKPIKTISL